MKSININKKIELDNEIIEIIYMGISQNDNTNFKKIEKLIDGFIDKIKTNDMINNIAILRTILREYQEKTLVIFYQNGTTSELVKYDNLNLLLYERNQKNKYFDKYKIKYAPIYGIKLNYNNQDKDISDYLRIELVSKEISELIKKIFYLQNIHTLDLTYNDKLLIEVYKLFYEENPDFASHDINIKIQTMISILGEFGITLPENYSFNLFKNNLMPLSINLEQQVNKLYPFGEIVNAEYEIYLDAESKRIIQIVGKYIRNNVYYEKNPLKLLINLSKVIYAEKYCFSNFDFNTISRFTNVSINEIESNLKLVKNIERQILYSSN